MGQEALSILIVDDEPALVLVLERALQRKGYSTFTVHSAKDGLERLQRSIFDLILCDMSMPDMNGAEFYQRMKDQAPSMVNHFVLMTGELLSPDLQDFIAEHKINLIMKPFDLNALYQVVSQTLSTE